MLTEQTLRNFITKLGHIPASPSICLDKISKLPQNEELQFFVNKHNLCWFADKQFLRNYNFDNPDKSFGLFTTNVRDIKLSELIPNLI
jgi:uncharacterized protein YneR